MTLIEIIKEEMENWFPSRPTISMVYEEDDQAPTNDLTNKLEILKLYINILNKSEKNDYDLPITYFIILHNFLILEQKYHDEVEQAGKEINKHLKLEKLNDEKEVYQKFLELYDVSSLVRFAAETMDSIELIRQYLHNNPQICELPTHGKADGLGF